MFDLFIDLDDTLISELPAPESELFLQRRLMSVLRDEAVARGEMDRASAEQLLTDVERTTPWWRWADYLSPLRLDSKEFWTAADAYMRPHVRPRVANVARLLRTIRTAGHRIWITSNNPVDGISHKLRLLGINELLQKFLFDGLIGTDRARAMKWDVAFWQNALAITEASPANVVVIGDNPRDDMLVPTSAGLTCGLLIPLDPKKSPPDVAPGWRVLTSFAQVPRALRVVEQRSYTSSLEQT